MATYPEYNGPSGIGEPITKEMLLDHITAERKWDPQLQRWVYVIGFSGWSSAWTTSRQDYEQIRDILGRDIDPH